MIREANKFDIPKIIEMLWNYHDSGSIKGLAIESEETASRILTHILLGGGIALVSEKNNTLTGMLLAIRTPFIWDMNKSVMNEIAYWVEPQYRGGSAGYRLLNRYVEMCNDYKDEGKIDNFTMSQLEGQTLDYSRFGFKPVEHTWSI